MLLALIHRVLVVVSSRRVGVTGVMRRVVGGSLRALLMRLLLVLLVLLLLVLRLLHLLHWELVRVVVAAVWVLLILTKHLQLRQRLALSLAACGLLSLVQRLALS